MTMLRDFSVSCGEMVERADRLMSAASNRYRIVEQVSRRAQRWRFEDDEKGDPSLMKPVIRAVLEMSDELTEPEILGHDLN